MTKHTCGCCEREMIKGWYPVGCDVPIREQCIDCGYCVDHCQCENRFVRNPKLIRSRPHESSWNV